MSKSEPGITQPVPMRLLATILLGVAVLAISLRIIPQPRTIDDAFITFRYSRNIVEGQGFVYNPDVKTLGTTTPLYTLLMAGIAFVTGSDAYPQFALIVNALADGITAALLAYIGHHLTQRKLVALILGVLWAISPMSVTFAIGGMETSVVILWMVTTVTLYLRGHDRGMAFFAALGMLTRIDSVLWIGPIFLHQFVIHWRTHSSKQSMWGRIPWQRWGVFLLTIAPWYAFSLGYFNTLLPRSLSAKRVAYAIDDLHALTRLIQHLATPFMDQRLLGVPGIVIGVVLYPALAAAGTLYTAHRYPRLVPFLLYPWLYTIVFSIMNPLIFRWYLAPILPAYFLAIVLGVWALTDAAATTVKRNNLRRAIPLVTAIWFILLAVSAWTLHPDHGPNHPAPKMAWHKIELEYKRMGEMLRDIYAVTPQTVLAAGDIGAIGYYSRATILDTVGLISPEMSDYYPAEPSIFIEGANYAVPPEIIADHEPDYIVFMEMFVRNGLAQQEWFADMYEQIAFIPTDYYGEGMIAYQHRVFRAQ